MTHNRPSLRRPEDGFAAWQATLGYISQHHSPDALLKLKVYPIGERTVRWMASVSWGQTQETVEAAESLPAALTQLWQQVERFHTVFHDPEEAIRKPEGYAPYEWLDVNTQDILHRLIWTTQTVFNEAWHIVILYQPTEISHTRVQIRLLALNSTVSAGGRGPSLLEAARDVFRKAVPVFVSNVSADQEIEPE